MDATGLHDSKSINLVSSPTCRIVLRLFCGAAYRAMFSPRTYSWYSPASYSEGLYSATKHVSSLWIDRDAGALVNIVTAEYFRLHDTDLPAERTSTKSKNVSMNLLTRQAYTLVVCKSSVTPTYPNFASACCPGIYVSRF